MCIKFNNKKVNNKKIIEFIESLNYFHVFVACSNDHLSLIINKINNLEREEHNKKFFF